MISSSVNIMHHPSDQQLIEYAAGSLPLSRALCVSAHLEHCPHCQQNYQRLQALGGIQMQSMADKPVSTSLKDKVLAAIKTDAANDHSDNCKPALAASASVLPPSSHRAQSNIPHCLKKFVPDNFASLNWRKISPTVSLTELTTEGNGAKAALVRVKAGGQMSHHSHTGDEITVVLQGSFSDEEGFYRQGDFVFRDSAHKHKPIATNDQDCICLIVLDGPIQFTGFFSRLLNPFLRLSHPFQAGAA